MAELFVEFWQDLVVDASVQLTVVVGWTSGVSVPSRDIKVLRRVALRRRFFASFQHQHSSCFAPSHPSMKIGCPYLSRPPVPIPLASTKAALRPFRYPCTTTAQKPMTTALTAKRQPKRSARNFPLQSISPGRWSLHISHCIETQTQPSAPRPSAAVCCVLLSSSAIWSSATSNKFRRRRNNTCLWWCTMSGRGLEAARMVNEGDSRQSQAATAACWTETVLGGLNSTGRTMRWTGAIQSTHTLQAGILR